ncbi:hypothetical protein OG874_35075 [Nocardia sp. NBC_00565]|uniref:hypothetical protein n=1 Tax=Nocardia sp. NBC_00565 TaxID=2975993 RepID=UPI002E81FA63|nr:hypothetical protein [Nocardia sp. NBC_00565]WUC01921.1 hypothetical protein OG874_35075 [Nocardia sp. NBC_00565]
MKVSPPGNEMKDATDTSDGDVTTPEPDSRGDDTDAPEVSSSGQDDTENTAVAGTDDKSPSSRRRWVLRGAAAFVVVVLIALVVGAGIAVWKLEQRKDIDDAARQAADTARTYAVTLTSIDFQHIDQNFTDVLNGSTGEFKDMYSKSSNQLKSLLVQNNAVSKGNVVDSSVKSASENRVEVMLFVDQMVTNTQSPAPRVDRSRVVMTMERVDGHWLASKVEMV